MALPIRRLQRLGNINVVHFYRSGGCFKVNNSSNVSRCLRLRNAYTVRYLPCSLYSQQPTNNETKTSTSTTTTTAAATTPSPKPGLIKRLLIKSDDIFCAVLGRISPWMLQEYGHFKIGFMAFGGDVKSVYGLSKRIKKDNLQLTDLHWKDLYVMKQLSNDMAKMAPTVILLSLPIVYYFVLPLAFLYPSVFLSNQFLSRDKLLQYYLKSYQKRAALYPTIIDLLSQHADKLQSSVDKQSLLAVLKKMKSEQQATLQQVLKTKDAFHSIQLNQLSRSHLACLCKMCSLRTFFMPGFLLRRKVNKNVALIQAMDNSITKGGGSSTLEQLDLEKLCYERGLNTVHLDRTDMEVWLQKWLELSAETSHNDRSFVAHSVALLVVGHPSCHQLTEININQVQEQQEERKG